MTNKSSYSEHVGRVIRDLSHIRGLSVADLARTTQIPRVTLDRRLAGDGRLTVAEMARLADALGVEITDLLPQMHLDGATLNRDVAS